MTTIQARSWAHAAQGVAKVRDHRRLWEIAQAALGITLLVALLAAGLAIRVLVYVPL